MHGAGDADDTTPGHGHGHAHGMRSGGSRHKGRLAMVLGLTSFYLVVEVVAGLLTHSLALLADAGHMLTDVAGLLLALFAIAIAERPATPRHTYGLYRVEIIAAMVNAGLLLGISGYVMFEAVARLRAPLAVASRPMLVVAVLGLFVNVACALVLHEGASKSLNLRGAYFEVLADAVTSVGVIAAGALMWATGWYYADPIVSVGIGLFILPRTWQLLREAVSVLLEGTPRDVDLASLRRAIAELNGVAGVHDLHVWSLTSGVNAMSVHVVRKDGQPHDEILERVQRHVREHFQVSHVTVQVESTGCEAHEVHL